MYLKGHKRVLPSSGTDVSGYLMSHVHILHSNMLHDKIQNRKQATPNPGYMALHLSVLYSDSRRGLRPLATSRAYCLAAVSSCSLGTTASTSPALRALSCLMGCDVSIICMLSCRPTKRGRRWVPPKPGRIPSCSSGRPRRDPAAQDGTC